MFLDEELEQILGNSNTSTPKGLCILSVNLFDCMRKRLPNQVNMPVRDILIELKRIDNSWKLFCQRHPEMRFNTNFWRTAVLENDKGGKLKRALGW